QESVQAPCGPPWIMKTAGYFFEGSKPGGTTTQAWSFDPSAAVVNRSETAPSAESRKNSSLTRVRSEWSFPSVPTVASSAARVRLLSEKKSRCPSADGRKPLAPRPRQISWGAPPEIDNRKITLRAATWLTKKSVLESGDHWNSSTQLSKPSVND